MEELPALSRALRWAPLAVASLLFAVGVVGLVSVWDEGSVAPAVQLGSEEVLFTPRGALSGHALAEAPAATVPSMVAAPVTPSPELPPEAEEPEPTPTPVQQALAAGSGVRQLAPAPTPTPVPPTATPTPTPTPIPPAPTPTPTVTPTPTPRHSSPPSTPPAGFQPIATVPAPVKEGESGSRNGQLPLLPNASSLGTVTGAPEWGGLGQPAPSHAPESQALDATVLDGG